MPAKPSRIFDRDVEWRQLEAFALDAVGDRVLAVSVDDLYADASRS